MNRFILSSVSALTILAAVPAVAADLGRMPTKAPIAYAPTAPNWTGLYIGVMGGYGWGDMNLSVTGVDLARVDQKGGFFGGTVGFNWQAPGSMWVFGIEGDGAISDFKTSTGIVGPDTATINAFGTIRGRVGVALNNVLLYGTGGLAIGGMKLEGPGLDLQRNHVGYAVGAGVEYGFSRNWSAKVEYTYLNFGTEAYFGVLDIRSDMHTVKGGINYRIGGI